MNYGIPEWWPIVDKPTFDAALNYVRYYNRVQFDVLVYSEARSPQRRPFAVETNEGVYYLHPDLLEAMGSEMG